MPKTRGGLGRGIGALIPGAQSQPTADELGVAPEGSAEPTTGFMEVPIDRINPNPHQPRQEFESEALHQLADSIREHGVLQPLVVTRAGGTPGHETYNLIAGERRWRASKLAGLDNVPIVVKEATPTEMLAMALVENIQRADLNPLEEARAYRELMDTFDLTQEVVARMVGRSRTTVANTVRLLNLPPEIIRAMQGDDITAGHGRAILQLQGREAQLEMLQQVIEQGYSVRQTEEMIRRIQAGDSSEEGTAPEQPEAEPLKPRQRIAPDLETSALEQQFREALKTKVALTRSSRGGKLVIHFQNEEILNQIYQLIVQHEEQEG